MYSFYNITYILYKNLIFASSFFYLAYCFWGSSVSQPLSIFFYWMVFHCIHSPHLAFPVTIEGQWHCFPSMLLRTVLCGPMLSLLWSWFLGEERLVIRQIMFNFFRKLTKCFLKCLYHSTFPPAVYAVPVSSQILFLSVLLGLKIRVIFTFKIHIPAPLERLVGLVPLGLPCHRLQVSQDELSALFNRASIR